MLCCLMMMNGEGHAPRADAVMRSIRLSNSYLECGTISEIELVKMNNCIDEEISVSLRARYPYHGNN